MNKKYDVITIGSASEDVFIKSELFKIAPCVRIEGQTNICLPYGRKIDLEELQFGLGGGAFNTVIGFKRQGLKAAPLLNLGKDLAAEKIKEKLKKEGTPTQLIMQDEKHLSGFSIIIRRARGDRTILVYRGANNHFKARKIKWNELKKSRFFYISSFGSEDRVLEKLFAFAGKNGVKIAFNPGSEQRKKAEKMREILAGTEILFLNEGEALSFACERTVKEAAKKLNELGARIVVVTQGPEEVILYDGKKFYSRKPFPIKAKDTTGAGDAFGSGFTSAHIKGLPVKKCIEFGLASAWSVINEIGTTQGLPTQKESQKIIKKNS
ncbi:MAG: carbohydrate kinase family protein [Candidatus Diapherotrites archaeon]